MIETTAVLINLENCWEPIRMGRETFSTFENKFKTMVLDKIKEASENNKYPVFYFALCKEPEFLPTVYLQLLIPLKTLLTSIGVHQLNFITWSASKDFLDKHLVTNGNIENIPYKTISVNTYVEYYLLWDYYRVVVADESYNKMLNPTADRCLFLTGKALAPHRIGLLSKFYKKGLMNRLEWSLFMSDFVRQHGRKYTTFTPDEYSNFLNECERNPDSIEENTENQITEATGAYRGYPYDVKLFENTSMSIVSETNIHRAYDSVVLSEKTWKTILNNHPFIMVSVPGTLKKLKELGFKTFEEYMLIKDYDSIRDPDERLDSVVVNMEHFLDNYAVNAEQIIRDTKFNFLRYMELVDEEFTKIHNLIKTHGRDEIHFLFNRNELIEL